VLDVGCGDGILCAQLAQTGIPHVVGLDADADVLDRARSHHPGLPIEWIHGDILEVAFAERFDAVLSVASLHHLDAAKGLARFAQMVKPRGVVGVIGLAANQWSDLPYAAVAESAKLILGFMRGHWEHSAFMAWPPPATYQQMKSIATNILPGARYKRHLLGRYSLIWEKPDD
jgi:2-polyprenyl-3-methyl-5-hydroxy-6-metoxy-1,4-benzoquinol methylase